MGFGFRGALRSFFWPAAAVWGCARLLPCRPEGRLGAPARSARRGRRRGSRLLGRASGLGGAFFGSGFTTGACDVAVRGFGLFGKSEFGTAVAADAAARCARLASGFCLRFEMLASSAERDASQPAADRKDDFVHPCVVEQFENDVETVSLILGAMGVGADGDADAERLGLANQAGFGLDVSFLPRSGCRDRESGCSFRPRARERGEVEHAGLRTPRASFARASVRKSRARKSGRRCGVGSFSRSSSSLAM